MRGPIARWSGAAIWCTPASSAMRASSTTPSSRPPTSRERPASVSETRSGRPGYGAPDGGGTGLMRAGSQKARSATTRPAAFTR